METVIHFDYTVHIWITGYAFCYIVKVFYWYYIKKGINVFVDIVVKCVTTCIAIIICLFCKTGALFVYNCRKKYIDWKLVVFMYWALISVYENTVLCCRTPTYATPCLIQVVWYLCFISSLLSLTSEMFSCCNCTNENGGYKSACKTHLISLFPWLHPAYMAMFWFQHMCMVM